MLVELGGRRAQGHLYGRPAPLAALDVPAPQPLAGWTRADPGLQVGPSRAETDDVDAACPARGPLRDPRPDDARHDDETLYRSALVRELRDPDRLRELASAPYDGPWRHRARTLVALAAQMLSTEIAEVNLVADTTLQVLAAASRGPYEVPVELSYCQHVVGSGQAVVVYDAAEDPRLRDSPTSARLRGYLGIPLTHRGQVLGALCVAQATPRDWTDTEVCLLTELAATLLTGDGWVP